jgi:hypothetical protein
LEYKIEVLPTIRELMFSSLHQQCCKNSNYETKPHFGATLTTNIIVFCNLLLCQAMRLSVQDDNKLKGIKNLQ